MSTELSRGNWLKDLKQNKPTHYLQDAVITEVIKLIYIAYHKINLQQPILQEKYRYYRSF